jgi:hypothetical protein
MKIRDKSKPQIKPFSSYQTALIASKTKQSDELLEQ